MATVTVEVHGRPYAVGCADGQEERVRDLAAQFNERVQGVADQVGQVDFGLKTAASQARQLLATVQEVRAAVRDGQHRSDV